MDLSFLNNIYEQKLFENERNINFWQHYQQNLDALDFNVYTEKLSLPILVPIGSKILFRGKLKHTNEVTVALGGDYFAKCSVQQAEILRKHRIQDAKAKLKQYQIEREHLQNQLSFCKQSLLEVGGHDIVEQVTEEEDKAWRERHRDNVKKYKQRKDKSDEFPNSNMSDKELMDILDELELQEELENEIELHNNDKNDSKKDNVEEESASAQEELDNNDKNDSKKDIVEEESASAEEELHKNDRKKDNIEEESASAEEDDKIDSDDDDSDHDDKPVPNPSKKKVKKKCDLKKERQLKAENERRQNLLLQPSKLELFEIIVDSHNTFKEIVTELRTRQREGLAHNNMEGQLDEAELEKLKSLEAEIATLEDECSTDYDDYIEVPEDETDSESEVKRSVVFADRYEVKTYDILFRHSSVEPSNVPYDPKKGIEKPSDVYEACSSDFTRQTISILKKPKATETPEKSKITIINNDNIQEHEDPGTQNISSNTIVVRDVIEKVDCNDNCVKSDERPVSLFKKRRQQQKK